METVPYLKTALTGPLLDLEKICLTKKNEIERWFRIKWQKHTPPFYGSVDLRNSGFKLTPVDMNLFPGGFNNINDQFIPLAVHAISGLITNMCPNAKKLLLIPENHTRNLAYFNNIYALQQILQLAGVETAIGSLSSEITKDTEFKLTNGKTLTYTPIIRVGNRIRTISGFDPCLILLNNDLSNGKPDILTNLEQTLLPPLNAGWYTRKKTNFFTKYNEICDDFAKLIDIDPWQINPYFDICSNLDFTNKDGLKELANKVDIMLNKIANKYLEENIKEKPYVVVKANNGTYGMGIMIVKSGQDILNINRKERNKMAVIKEGHQVHEVIIQEGVHTFEEIDGKVAEPVVYMINNFVIGGFYRVHSTKRRDENLNAAGADFIPLTFASHCIAKLDEDPDCPPNRFYTYGVIARLALLSSSLELEQYI